MGDRVIGALTVQSVEEAAFSEDDITALQAMADQLAVAIHNARLYTENARLLAQATRRARLLMAAADVGKGVTSILDLDELLHKMVDIICDAYGFYYAGVFLLDRDRDVGCAARRARRRPARRWSRWTPTSGGRAVDDRRFHRRTQSAHRAGRGRGGGLLQESAFAADALRDGAPAWSLARARKRA